MPMLSLKNIKQDIYLCFFKRAALDHVTNYKDLIDILIQEQRAQMFYHKAVIVIGVIGMGFSAWLFFELDGGIRDKIFTNTDYFPSAIWSLMITAFNGIELENNKRKLYELVARKMTCTSWEDVFDLIKDMKEYTWEEFKNLYHVKAD